MIEKKPKYDGLHVFHLNLKNIKSGDVLLTRNVETESSRDKLQSDIIAKVSGGNFSHVLLCTTPPIFIEAIGHGVSNISVQNCFAHNLENVKLLRYNDTKIASAAASAALLLIGQKYSLRAALCSVLPNVLIPDMPEDQKFCSALVAAVFRKAGAPEFLSINPLKVTPAVLEKSEHFKDVTSEVFVRFLSPKNIEEMTALDGDRGKSPVAGQAELFRSYYNILLPLIDKFIEKTKLLLFKKTPTSFLECVMFIAGAKSVCDRLPDAVAEIPRIEIARIDDVGYKLLSDGRFGEMFKKTETAEGSSLQRMIVESFAHEPDIDLENTIDLIIATKKQICDRSKIFDTELRGVSRVFDEWLRISEEVVEMLTLRLYILEEVFTRVTSSKRI